MRAWNKPPSVNKELKPSLLSQANVPKPLHGINPRTIMGDAIWRRFRQEKITNMPYCKACGKEHIVLDLHEDYSIDYQQGIMTVNDYVPLCKLCHMFIHTGFVASQIKNRQFTREYGRTILKHGFSICREHNVKPFIVAKDLAKALKVDIQGLQFWQPKHNASWDRWKLIYNGRVYKGISLREWKSKYG